MAAMTDVFENLVINVFRGTTLTAPANIYLALFTAATTDAGGGTEVTGGSYARQIVVFTAPSPAGTTANSALLTFTNMPACTVTHAALCSTLAGLISTDMWVHAALTNPKAVAAGASFTVAIGDVDWVVS